MEQIKVLIADDHDLMRQGLGKVLGLESRIQVIGEVGDGQGAINLARRCHPDLILMDINMPGTNGIEAVKVIKRELPEIKIIALTIHSDEEYVFELFKSGINGYLLKDVDADGLIKAIIGAVQGIPVIHPAITGMVVGEFRRLSQVAEDDLLTSRELEILRLIAQGTSNRDIASKLYISEKTVKNHVTNLFRKINVSDRTQAAVYAYKHRLVSLN